MTFLLNESDKTCSIKYNKNAKNAIFIPRSIRYKSNEYIITKINNHSFQNSMLIKTISFPIKSELQTIDKFAFAYSSIENILIPSSITEICEKAMFNCKSLKSIQFYDDSKLQTIGEYAFSKSSLESIIITSQVKKNWSKCILSM